MLFQFSAILLTWITLLKSQLFIRNPINLSRTDLILTNKPRSYQRSCVIETGLSDFHKMTATVIKAFFEKLQPRVMNYREYKYLKNNRFRTDLLSQLGKANTEKKKKRIK